MNRLLPEVKLLSTFFIEMAAPLVAVTGFLCNAMNTSVASVDLVDVGQCHYTADSYGENTTVNAQVQNGFCSVALPSNYP